MSKYTIELGSEQIDRIIVEDLKMSYEMHLPKNRPSCGLYSTDLAEDLKEMKKTRKALERVLTYYGVIV